MYKKSVEKSNRIKELYEQGVHLNDIAERTTSSTVTVKKILLSLGIDYTKVKEEDYKKRLAQVVELYNQGKSQLFLEKELNLTRLTIRRLLKAAGLKYRNSSEQHHIRYNTEIDHSCFDQLTPESLYWIGMIYTDGSVGRKEACVELTQHSDDMTHLEKFKTFLKSSRRITLNKEGRPSSYKGRSISKKAGSCGRIRINSKQIHSRLIELGVTPAKSLIAKPHELIKHSRDFWRGCIDGDGTVYNYPERYTKGVSLCGTLETIFDFIIFCSKQAGVKEKYPSPAKSSGPNIFQVHYYGDECEKILNLLYKDAPVYLDRKFEKYKEIIGNTADF